MFPHRTIIATLSLIAAAAVPAYAQTPGAPPSRCFMVDQLQNWRAPDDKTIYIRVQLGKFYRLDLAQDCPELKYADSHIVLRVHGPEMVCYAVDLDLLVAQSLSDIKTACIVKSITPLAPDEVAAIPAKFKP
jgi:hypothetical protein